MALHYKKDGTLDMRYASSKRAVAAQSSSPSYPSYEMDRMRSTPAYDPYQAMFSRAAVKPDPSQSLSYSSFTSADIFPNKDGTINRNSSAVRSGDILVRADGKIDRRSTAVRQGRLKLDHDGNPAWEEMGIPRRVDDNLTTNDIRSPASQRKYREESRSTQKEDKDVCHYLGLGVACKCLESKPGVKPTIEKLRSDLQPLNSSLNYRMKLRSTNLGSDKEYDNRIIRMIDNEDVPMTREFANRIMMIKEVIDSIPPDQMNSSLNHIKQVFNDKVVAKIKDW